MEAGTGVLTALPDAFQLTDNYSGLENWSWVTVDPSGSLVYATDTGPNRDRTSAFVISDGVTPGESAGQIIEVSNDNGSVAYNPDKVLFHPSGDIVYITGNTDFIGVANVDTDPSSVDYGSFTGITSTSRSRFDMVDFVTDMVLSPNGRFLYVSTSRNGSSPRIRIYQITLIATANENRGHLTLVRSFKSAGEVQALVISPDGRYLFGGDVDNDQILSWSIDATNGDLSNIDRLPGTPAHDGYATSTYPDVLAVHPSGRILYVGVNDGLLIHDIDISTGAVSEFNPALDVPLGNSDPDQIVIHRVQ